MLVLPWTSFHGVGFVPGTATVVFTSNIGASEAMRMHSAPFASIERTVLARVGQQLRPELAGRMTEKIVFARLSYEVQREICEAMIAGELARLKKWDTQ